MFCISSLIVPPQTCFCTTTSPSMSSQVAYAKTRFSKNIRFANLGYLNSQSDHRNCYHRERHDSHEWKDTDPALARVQLQAKILTLFTSIDSACTERVKRKLKEALAMTLRDKNKHFDSLERYLEFRIVDSGAP
jgi:hypothetical protein